MHFQVEEVQADDEDEDNIKNGDGDMMNTDNEDRNGISNEIRGGADNSGIDSTEREEQQSGQGYTEEIASSTSYVIPYFYQPMNGNAGLVEGKEAMQSAFL
jgi:hypothetical protein